MTRLLWLLVAIILLTSEAVSGHRYSLADILEDEFFDEPEEEFPYKNLRLPGNIVPSEYELYLHPNITDGHFKYYGDIKIHFNVRNATDSIILHSEKLTHTYARVYEDAPHKTEIGIRKVLTNPKLDFVLLRLDRELTENKRCVLHVRFNSVLKAGLKGFYRSSYKTKSGKTKFLATTQFEATGARMAFPCFDEPAMKAKFSIRIVREKIHTALSNMPIERTIERKDGLLMDFFEKSVKMSTYLVAFVVCEFAHINTTSSNGVKVRVWAPKDLISQAKYALQVAPKVLDYYEKFFKAKFPLPKQDMIAIPDFAAGAMENWGLITYRTTDLLIDEVHSSVKNKERVVQTIAHELAHQWFGNLVTMKWWNDLWLNEGFARFVENIGINAFSTSWDIFNFFVPHYLQSALALDSKLNSHPISVVVTDPNSIGGLFDTISYSKGASIIRMMSDFLGEKIFTDGLAAYLQKHKYGNAESDDLWEALSTAADNKVDVRTIMNTWIKKMGYPVLNVAHDPIKNIATLKQERFVTDISNDIPSYKWEVPVTYYFQNDKTKKRSWMHVNDDSVNIAWPKTVGWLKLNANNTGFYRVNYDLKNWILLIDQLKTDHTVLYPSDRANLIDDAFALAKTGRLSYETALDLSEYLLKETNYTPMYRALLSLGHVEKFLRGRLSHRIFKKYLINLYTPLAKKLGWKNEGTNLEKMLRPLVLSKLVYYGDKDAVDNALKYYKGWMNGEGIPADLQSVVYLAGSKYGGEEEWQFMFEKFSTTMYPSEKSRLMASLAYTSVPSILKKYLMNTINSNVIRSQDTCSIIGLIAANPLGKKMAQAFVKYQWPLLFKRYESKTALLRLFPSVFGGKTPEDLKEARYFFQTHKLGSGKLAAKRTLASIQVGIHWLANNEKQVENWLKKKIL